MELYSVVKDDLETSAKVKKWEVIAETNISVTLLISDYKTISFSRIKVGTEYFETPEGAIGDYIRRQREYIEELEKLVSFAKVALADAEKLEEAENEGKDLGA